MFCFVSHCLKSFGLIEGERVAIIIDSSNSNMGFGRAIELQDSLLVHIDIIYQKLIYMQKLCIIILYRYLELD